MSSTRVLSVLSIALFAAICTADHYPLHNPVYNLVQPRGPIRLIPEPTSAISLKRQVPKQEDYSPRYITTASILPIGRRNQARVPPLILPAPSKGWPRKDVHVEDLSEKTVTSTKEPSHHGDEDLTSEVTSEISFDAHDPATYGDNTEASYSNAEDVAAVRNGPFDLAEDDLFDH